MRHNETQSGPSVRVLRVGEQVRHVLSEILQRGDVHDDVLAKHPVSITEVRMSPDLRHATVFVKPLLGQDEEVVLKADDNGDDQYAWYVDQTVTEACGALNIDAEALLSGGYTVYTALDGSLQKSAQSLYRDAARFPAQTLVPGASVAWR